MHFDKIDRMVKTLCLSYIHENEASTYTNFDATNHQQTAKFYMQSLMYFLVVKINMSIFLQRINHHVSAVKSFHIRH